MLDSSPPREADYPANSILVDRAIKQIQPANGTDYSSAHHRQQREQIALNVHAGRNPLEGLR